MVSFNPVGSQPFFLFFTPSPSSEHPHHFNPRGSEGVLGLWYSFDMPWHVCIITNKKVVSKKKRKKMLIKKVTEMRPQNRELKKDLCLVNKKAEKYLYWISSYYLFWRSLCQLWSKKKKKRKILLVEFTCFKLEFARGMNKFGLGCIRSNWIKLDMQKGLNHITLPDQKTFGQCYWLRLFLPPHEIL